MVGLRCLTAAAALAALLGLAAAAGPGSRRPDFWFPRGVDDGSAERPRRPLPPAKVAPKEIPLDVLRMLNEVGNVTYFINNFVDSASLIAFAPEESGADIGNRFGGEERKSMQRAKPALCEPQLEVVSLAQNSTDPTLYYYPTCTRVERCGGCCGSGLMSCQPVETEIVNFQVIVTQYTGDYQMEFKGHKIIPIEKHVKCKCDCKVKETDCKQFQEYRQNECACTCINTDEQEKCNAQSDIKVWDSSTCSCQCKESRGCSTGAYYDQDACRCLRVPSRNRRGNWQEVKRK